MVHMVDLVVVRGFLVPFLLYRILVAHQSQRRNDVIPPNMLSWTAVGILVAIAFHAAGTLVPSEPGQQMHVAVAASSLLLGFFVLATQDGPFSQAVGALRIEYAVALFELASRGRGVPLALYVGQAIVFVLTISTYAVYVRLLHPGAPAIPPSEQPIL
jgi:hydrogenase-4 membrane subunit HyfE